MIDSKIFTMRIVYFLFFLLLGVSVASACDIDGDGIGDSFTKVSSRKVLVQSSTGTNEIINLDRAARSVECAEGHGIVIRNKKDRITFLSAKKLPRSLSSVCKNVRNLTRGEIWKSIASTHIPTSDPRRFSTSFITLRGTGAPRNSCLYVYNSKGVLVHKLGKYYISGAAYSSRYYGGYGCGDKKRASQVANSASSGTGSTRVYITSGTKNCATISNPNACYNSAQC